MDIAADRDALMEELLTALAAGKGLATICRSKDAKPANSRAMDA